MFVLCASLFPRRGGKRQDLSLEYKLENYNELDRYQIWQFVFIGLHFYSGVLDFTLDITEAEL